MWGEKDPAPRKTIPDKDEANVPKHQAFSKR
jgi:hypothetical protein